MNIIIPKKLKIKKTVMIKIIAQKMKVQRKKIMKVRMKVQRKKIMKVRRKVRRKKIMKVRRKVQRKEIMKVQREDNENSEEDSGGDNENLDREYDKYMSCSNKKKENLRYKTKFVEENGGKKIAIIKVGDKEESEYVGIMSEKGREIIEKYGSREDRYILEISKNNSNMRKILKEGATYEELLKMCYECYIKDIDILYIYIGRWV